MTLGVIVGARRGLERAEPHSCIVLRRAITTDGEAPEVVTLPASRVLRRNRELAVEFPQKGRPACMPGDMIRIKARVVVERLHQGPEPYELTSALRNDHTDRLVHVEHNRDVPACDLPVHRERRDGP